MSRVAGVLSVLTEVELFGGSRRPRAVVVRVAVPCCLRTYVETATLRRCSWRD